MRAVVLLMILFTVIISISIGIVIPTQLAQ